MNCFFLLFAYGSGLRTLFGGRGGCAQEWPRVVPKGEKLVGRCSAASSWTWGKVIKVWKGVRLLKPVPLFTKTASGVPQHHLNLQEIPNFDAGC